MSKKRYKSLVYWANVGYGAKGKDYVKRYPDRKDPWYKINQDTLECTVGEELSKYILEVQEFVHKKLKDRDKKGDLVLPIEVHMANIVANKLVSILLNGYSLHKTVPDLQPTTIKGTYE